MIISKEKEVMVHFNIECKVQFSTRILIELLIPNIHNTHLSYIEQLVAQKKQILELTSLTNKKLSEPEGIEEEIVSFYKELMGSALLKHYLQSTGTR